MGAMLFKMLFLTNCLARFFMSNSFVALPLVFVLVFFLEDIDECILILWFFVRKEFFILKLFSFLLDE